MNPQIYVCESCTKQNAVHPRDFAGMGIAYGLAVEYAANVHKGLRPGIINVMARAVNGLDLLTTMPFRKFQATFQNGNVALPPQLIMRQFDLLLDNALEMSPSEFYYRFEEIHPFMDGNGRVGSLLFNMLGGDGGGIFDPVHPPDFWSNDYDINS